VVSARVYEAEFSDLTFAQLLPEVCGQLLFELSIPTAVNLDSRTLCCPIIVLQQLTQEVTVKAIRIRPEVWALDCGFVDDNCSNPELISGDRRKKAIANVVPRLGELEFRLHSELRLERRDARRSPFGFTKVMENHHGNDKVGGRTLSDSESRIPTFINQYEHEYASLRAVRD